MKLHTRIFLLIFGIELALLLTLALIQLHDQKHLLRTEQRSRMTMVLNLMRTELAWRDTDRDKLHRMARDVDDQTGYRVTLIDTNGWVIADSRAFQPGMDNHGNRPEVIAALTKGRGASHRFSDTIKRTMQYVAMPVPGETGAPAAVLRVAHPERSFEDLIRPLRVRLWVTLVVLVLIAVVSSYIIARLIRKPLMLLRSMADRLVDGSNVEPEPELRQSEYVTLAHSLRRLAHRVDDKVRTIRKLADDQRGVFRSIQEGLIVLDNDRVITQINPAACAMFNTPVEQAIGSDILAVARDVRMEEIVARGMAADEPVEDDIVMLDPEERYLQIHTSRLHTEEGEPFGLVLVFTDVTRLRKFEAMRRDFVASASHELKTPITVITGFAETLSEGDVPPDDARRYVEAIHRQARRMGHVIADLLNLTRIEHFTEHGKLDMEPVNLADLIRSAVQALKSQADDKNIRIETDCPADASASLDRNIMEHALINLVENAVKYSDPGTTVSIRVEQENKELKIRVIDQGPGIAEVHHDRVFERFYRIDKSRSRKLGGTGLGLSIVKHAAQAHGGSVAVESAVGKGSTFTISLPG